MASHPNILTRTEAIDDVLAETRRVAVLGIKPSSRAGQPAHYVPAYLLQAGLDVVPVPVYYPELDELLGQPVYRALAEVPGSIDMVNVFRRSHDIPPHLDDILAARPSSVWLQLGIRHDDVALALAEAGIKVVQDRCLMVDHRRWALTSAVTACEEGRFRASPAARSTLAPGSPAPTPDTSA